MPPAANTRARRHKALAAPAPPRGTNLRQAAQAVLDTWDDDADRGALAGPMERLRAAVAPEHVRSMGKGDNCTARPVPLPSRMFGGLSHQSALRRIAG